MECKILKPIGAVCGITTVLLVLLFGQTRVFLAMARDGMLPHSVAALHSVYGTPHRITTITGITVAALSGTLPLDIIAELTNAGTLFAFIVSSIGVLVLRRTQPNARRPFRCPAVNIISPLAILLCGYLMLNLPLLTWQFFGVWTVAGLVVYFLYGRKHCLTVKEPPKENGTSG